MELKFHLNATNWVHFGKDHNLESNEFAAISANLCQIHWIKERNYFEIGK